MVAVLMMATFCFNAYDDMSVHCESPFVVDAVVAAVDSADDSTHDQEGQPDSDSDANKVRRTKSLCVSQTCHTVGSPTPILKQPVKGHYVATVQMARPLRTLHCIYRI